MRQRYRITLLIGLLLLTFLSPPVIAGNPVIKDRFTADPAALVHDGKLYLYTGHDEATPADHFFVLKEWNVFSSEDGINWTFETAVPRSTFRWAIHDSAWASQAIERDGIFYWYTTVHHSAPHAPGYAIGVMTSETPTGPFVDALNGPLIDSSMTDAPEFMGTVPWDNIDPTVFIDDDGSAYLYWGNTHLYYAKLTDEMTALDGEIHQIEIEHMPGHFTEGPFLFKREDLYYLTFAYNYPEEIAYATSHSPTGPWTFQEKIMDQIPNSGTSHPAVVEFNDTWYFIYHTTALAGGGEYRRSVAMEPMHFYDDGAIAKVTPTAAGLKQESVTISPSGTDLMLRQLTHALRLAEPDDSHQDYRWHETPGLTGEDGTVSYQINNNPGVYLIINEQDQPVLARHDGSADFDMQASFKKHELDSGTTLQPVNNDTLYLSAVENTLTFLPVTESNRTIQTFTIEPKPYIVPEQKKPLRQLPPVIETSETPESTEQQTENVTQDSETNSFSSERWFVISVVIALIITIISFIWKKNKTKTS